MKFCVRDTEFESCDIAEVINYCICGDYYDEDSDEYEDWVNDRYDNIEIAGRTYYAYEILDNFGNLGHAVEEFREDMDNRDWENADYELRHARPGEEIYIQAYIVDCIEEEEEQPETKEEDPNEDEMMCVEAVRARIFFDAQEEEKEKIADAESADNYLDLFQTIG